MTGSSYTGTISQVTADQTIVTTFGVDTMDVVVSTVSQIGFIKSASSYAPTTTILYSLDNSTWNTLLTLSTSTTWAAASSINNTFTTASTITLSSVTSGATLYLKLSSMPSGVSSISESRYSKFISTSSVAVTTLTTTTLTLQFVISMSNPKIIPTIGSNGSVSVTYTKYNATTTTTESLTSGTNLTNILYGSDISYTVTPDSGYAISTLTVNGTDPRS